MRARIVSEHLTEEIGQFCAKCKSFNENAACGTGRKFAEYYQRANGTHLLDRVKIHYKY